MSWTATAAPAATRAATWSPRQTRFFISKIYLKASERGRHLASDVVAHYMALCRERGLDAMYLTVNKHNELGIRCYRGHGFEVIDAVETSIGEGFVMDDYIMEKRVPQLAPDARLIVMDIDSTLINEEVIDLLGDEAGAGEQVAAITERAMRGELDFRGALEERVGLLAGLDAGVFDRAYARVTFTPGARELVAEAHRRGWRVGVVSGRLPRGGRPHRGGGGHRLLPREPPGGCGRTPHGQARERRRHQAAQARGTRALGR